MSDLSTTASLIVATMDLSVVRLLRQAIRTADLSSGNGGDSFTPSATIEPRPHIHPEPLIEPRPHVHPEPVYTRRPVIHPHPRVEQANLACPSQTLTPPLRIKLQNPIQPPWRVLPWSDARANAPQPRQTVKVHLHRTDVIRKGSVLDLFV